MDICLNCEKNKMKRIIRLYIAMTMLSTACYSQAHKFHYNLGKDSKINGSLMGEIDEIKGVIYFGYNELNPIIIPFVQDTTSIYRYETKSNLEPLEIIANIKVGTIKINESHDTLFLEPWYSVEVNPAKQMKRKDGTELSINNDIKYCFAIDWKKNTKIKIPFYYSQFAVTSLPFRFNLKDKKFSSDFLNANVAYLFIWGKTKFYKSKFLEPRSDYWGIGPYIGASTISDDSEEKKPDVFGFNYGINVVKSIQNINLSFAMGAESGFTTKKNAFIPYWGIGLGIKLIELYEPENKAD